MSDLQDMGAASDEARAAQKWIADYNAAHPDEPPFIYWSGHDNAPPDWDGGPYLCRDGGIYIMRGYGWRHGIGSRAETADWDRIGYRAVPNGDAPNSTPHEQGHPD